MSSSNNSPNARHKKSALLFLGLSESPKEEGDVFSSSASICIFGRSRVASVEIPIVRVRASFASYHPRVRKKIRNFIKRGGTNHTVDLQSSL